LPTLTRRAFAPIALAAATVGLAGCARETRETVDGGDREAAGGDPLPSWHDGASKRSLLNFVSAVTTEGSEYVQRSERIAVFDHDGTLWVEQPIYTEFIFVLARAREMVAGQPSLAQRAPFKALARNPAGGLPRLTKEDAIALLAATHTGITPEDFENIVNAWIGGARHPRLARPIAQCVYQPMLEVLGFLRASGFKTFLVSGGGVDFMRAFAERFYGVAPEQVIGSSSQARYELREGIGTIIKEPKLGSLDDKDAKPVNIALHIGRRPIAAFGNSDGDQAMLQYVTTGSGRRFGLIVHHDDADREFAYDRDSKVGRLSSALDEARTRGWTIASMRNDWRTVFPPGVSG
jgi:phosphoserine phosphatase